MSVMAVDSTVILCAPPDLNLRIWALNALRSICNVVHSPAQRRGKLEERSLTLESMAAEPIGRELGNERDCNTYDDSRLGAGPMLRC